MNGKPISVFVLNREYKLTFSDPVGWPNEELDGWCDRDRGLIFISSAIRSDARRKEVILHECLHALWWEYAWPGSKDEEATVTWMARALTRFFTENAELVREQLI